MSAWQTIDSAPKGRVILLYGELDVLPANRPLYSKGPSLIRAIGYWDAIDGAWSIVGSTWEGPWVKATHWQDAPEAPESAQ